MNKINFKNVLLSVVGIGLLILMVVCGFLGIINPNKLKELDITIKKEIVLSDQEKALLSIQKKQDELVDLAYSNKLIDLVILAKEQGLDIRTLENYNYIYKNGYDVDVVLLATYKEQCRNLYKTIFNELIIEVSLYNLMYFPMSNDEFQNYSKDDGDIEILKYPYIENDSGAIDTNTEYILMIYESKINNNYE